jgi:hypothetical protein
VRGLKELFTDTISFFFISSTLSIAMSDDVRTGALLKGLLLGATMGAGLSYINYTWGVNVAQTAFHQLDPTLCYFHTDLELTQCFINCAEFRTYAEEHFSVALRRADELLGLSEAVADAQMEASRDTTEHSNRLFKMVMGSLEAMSGASDFPPDCVEELVIHNEAVRDRMLYHLTFIHMRMRSAMS